MSGFFKGINKTAIMVVAILGFSMVAYGYMNVNYKNKAFEAEQRERTLNKELLNACLEEAEANFQSWLTRYCEKRKSGESCFVPWETQKWMEEEKDKHKAECFKKHSVK